MKKIRPWEGFGGLIDVMQEHLRQYADGEEKYGLSEERYKANKITTVKEIIKLLERMRDPDEYSTRRTDAVKEKYPKYKSMITKYKRSTGYRGDFLPQQQIYDLDNRITTLYEEKAEGLILPEDFYRVIKEIEAQRKAAEKCLTPLLNAIRKAEINTAEEVKWTSLIKEKSTLDEVDRDTLESLIDRIEVGAREGTNSHSTQEVKIYYRF
jgi:hypothetical protein